MYGEGGEKVPGGAGDKGQRDPSIHPWSWRWQCRGRGSLPPPCSGATGAASPGACNHIYAAAPVEAGGRVNRIKSKSEVNGFGKRRW